jgi:hypothetical protein
VEESRSGATRDDDNEAGVRLGVAAGEKIVKAGH